MRTSFLLMLMAVLALAGCGGSAEPIDGTEDDVKKDPLAMPLTIRKFLDTNDWGGHHLRWHSERQWDLLEQSDQKWAKRQGWERQAVQEGQKSNGLEFLAMHRVMLRRLVDEFPESKSLFEGWTVPPEDPADAKDPLPRGRHDAFDAKKHAAIERLMKELASFETDDDLGLFLETSLRPTANNPERRTTDKSAGLHNYLHGRFADDKSAVDVGDPSVNLANKRFWRIHGWIESRWTAYRKLKHRSDDDAEYQAAIQKAEKMLSPGHPKAIQLPSEPPPMSLRKSLFKD